MFVVRFDLRIPPGLTLTPTEQYGHALDMARWADSRGFATLVLSEHHDTDDGFMHSPMTIAAAMLGATSTIGVGVNALLVPLHDPVRLAEEIATIELMAPGRLSVTAGLGYRPSEFDMFGKSLRDRRRDFEDAIQLMLDAWSGEEVDYRGRRVRIHPSPATRPNLVIGGSVEASARRAARFRLPYCPAVPDQALADVYYQEAEAVGFTEPVAMLSGGPGLVMVTRDPGAFWADFGEQLLYDAQVYESWQEEEHRSSWRSGASSVEDLKASPNYAIVTPEECVDLVRRNGSAVLHPLVAGIDPRVGWQSLELVVDAVMPALAADPSAVS